MPPALPKSEDLAAFAELQTKVVRARRQLKMVRDERGRGALSLVRFFASLQPSLPLSPPFSQADQAVAGSAQAARRASLTADELETLPDETPVYTAFGRA